MVFVVWIVFCFFVPESDTMDVARNKPTKQSSNSEPFYRFSSKAVDGDYSQQMTSSFEFCSETSVGNEPSWWAVDHGAIYEISNVVIYGRNDCCEERLLNFIIEIIRPCRDNIDWFEDSRIDVCYHQHEPTTFLKASCHNKMIGKFVRIRLSNLNDRFALCEVEVHGIFIGFLKTDSLEVARYKLTKQSSNSGPLYRLSPKAVNGDYSQYMASSNEFCSETSVGNEPSWWAVDLGALYEISNVVIYGRNDCCEERLSNFTIEIIRPCRDNIDWFEDCRIDVCYHQQEPTSFLNASCHNKMIGKFVRIRLSNLYDRLALCEVEVHGIFIGFLQTATFPYACGFQGHSSDGHDEILSSVIVHSDIQCTFICSYMKYCHVADFNKKTSTCILMKKKSGSTLLTNSDHNVFIVN